MSKYPNSLLRLITFLKKFPGVGRKTAERFAFQILDWQERDLKGFAELLDSIQEKIRACDACGCLNENEGCPFCLGTREKNALCIIGSPRDVYSIEETCAFRGLYHVLPTLLSPLEGKTPEDLNMDHLKARIEQLEISEVIIALDSTLEGDATALYLKEELKDVSVSRLAFGLPMGSSLDFVDESTLSRAISGRQTF